MHLAAEPRPISLARRHDHVVSRRLGGASVLVNLQDNNIFELNETASRLWELLSFTHTVPALAEEISYEFEIEHSGAVRHVETLLRRLESQGLVCLSS